MKRLAVLVGALALGACDFEGALDDYCAQTGRCPDAGTGGGAGGGGGGVGGGVGGGGGGDAGFDAGFDAGVEPEEPLDSAEAEFLDAGPLVYAEARRPFVLLMKRVDGGQPAPTDAVRFVGEVFGPDGGRVSRGRASEQYALGAVRADGGARVAYLLGPSPLQLLWTGRDGGTVEGGVVTRDFVGKVRVSTNTPIAPFLCAELTVQLQAGEGSDLGLLATERPLSLTRTDGGDFFVHLDGGCHGTPVNARNLTTSLAGDDVVLSYRAVANEELAVAVDSPWVPGVATTPSTLVPVVPTLEVNGLTIVPGAAAGVLAMNTCVQVGVAWRAAGPLPVGPIVTDPNTRFPFLLNGLQVAVGPPADAGACVGFSSSFSVESEPGPGLVQVRLQRGGTAGPAKLQVSFPDGGNAATFDF